MSGPFKMKGSPMQRNFGVEASPAKQTESKDPTVYEKSGSTKEQIQAYKHKHRNVANKPKDYYTVIAGLTPR